MCGHSGALRAAVTPVTPATPATPVPMYLHYTGQSWIQSDEWSRAWAQLLSGERPRNTTASRNRPAQGSKDASTFQTGSVLEGSLLVETLSGTRLAA